MKHTLSTKWSNDFDTEHVLPEYPRPSMVRDSYINLNGYWNYTISTDSNVPKDFTGRILVPFSPEAPLSGVNRVLMPNEYLWYMRTFEVTAKMLQSNNRLLLHFGAVDQFAFVYVNGNAAGKHSGGYLPFTFDISELIIEGSNTITVMVRDVTDSSYHSRGKQKLKPGGMFYTPQSGIWQTVWLEEVPCHYISEVRLTPMYDSSELLIELTMDDATPDNDEEATISIYDGETVTARYIFNRAEPMKLWLPGFKSWSPEEPFLYTYVLETGEDRITGYFAMRKFSMQQDEGGLPRLFLNNKPYFHNGLLDQGYWPEGLYTAPTDEALCYDIETAKSLGFNMLRKHAKLEPARWYYHCDRLGMLVWQDMVNGGSDYSSLMLTYLPTFFFKNPENFKDNRYKLLSRENPAGRKEYLRELDATIHYLYNCPCIAMWVPFNEGWGQFDALEVTKRIRTLDKTRTIDHASGWFDQGGGDVKSMHIYFTAFKYVPEKRALVISEFGGYVYGVEGHTAANKIYGYKKLKTKEEYMDSYSKLYMEKILPGLKQGLSAIVFTQVSDIEEEINGLLTYDRKVLKIDSGVVHRINKQLCYDEQQIK